MARPRRSARGVARAEAGTGYTSCLTHLPRTLLVVFLICSAAACGGSDRSPTAPSPPPIGQLAGFTLNGDPTSANGARWTYQATAAGVTYDLQGILLRPAGSGSFPAVIISHGATGNATGYSLLIARTMVGWGLVCIATNYTHSSGVPIGAPGTAADPGASVANVQRARQLVEILRSLGYVDMNRLALHGHSLGAFVTTAVAAAHSDLFRAASHTAGGIAPDFIPDIIAGLAPTEAQIAGIRAPYQMHHGDRDFVVPVVADQLFDAALRARGVTHQLVIYPGASHDDVRFDPVVLDRVRAWYRSNGVL
jgi:dienelactone hydrolase